MRVLNVNFEYPPIGGGGGVAHSYVVQELAKRHQVDVITSWFPGLARYEERENLRIFRVPVLGRYRHMAWGGTSLLSFPPPAIAKAVQLCRKQRYDLVHTYFVIPSAIASVVPVKLFRLPHVLTVIGGDIFHPTKRLSPHRNPFLRPVASFVMNQADRLVAISQDVKQKVLEFYRVNKPVQVIHFGLPIARADHHEMPPKHERSDEDFTIVTVARLIKRKGIDTLLRSLSLLESLRFKAIIIGDGPDLPQLQAFARELGLQDRVQFMGFVPEERKDELLSLSDVFVLPSIHEGFGLVYIEAMRWGVPVIASNVGGQTDFLSDGETGYLVPPGDYLTLADRIKTLMSDRNRAWRMGELNKNIARNLSAEACAKAYEIMYRDLAGG
ncbi:MAG: glycosyltransferase family 4 protein [Candidatus Methanomethyliaceae archaeon]